jgi:hypothetical protein
MGVRQPPGLLALRRIGVHWILPALERPLPELADERWLQIERGLGVLVEVGTIATTILPAGYAHSAAA